MSKNVQPQYTNNVVMTMSLKEHSYSKIMKLKKMKPN